MSSSVPELPSRRTVAKAAALGAATMFTAAPEALATSRPVTGTRLGPRTYDLAIPSAALGGRTAPVRIILPTAFADRPTSTWPVLYLLHGAHDDYTSWTRETDIERFTEGLDLIVAMPDGGPTGIASKWRDGTDYETFQTQEVQAVLASAYRASGKRAVAGVSTGGYGAMAHAARHPGMFGAAAAYSGVLDTTFLGVPVAVDAIVAREHLTPWSLWGSLLLSYGTWEQYNPRARVEGLRGTGLYVSAGSGVAGSSGDLLPEVLESTLWPAAHSFTAALAELGIPVTQHFYNGGGHTWSHWRREFAASWPVLARGLDIAA